MSALTYIKNVAAGIWHLLQGMYITMLNMIRPKVTEQYPEKRGEIPRFESFRAMLTMPHDESNHHRCTGCGICEMNCPNGTIRVITKMEPDPVTGKERRAIDQHLYDLGSCIFCALCTQTCPFNAITWSNDFEHSLFTRGKLYRQLNHPGSSLKPKEVPAANPVPAEGAKTE